MPAHGEERDRRMETTYGRSVEYTTADGQPVYSGPGSSMTQTVREVWCGTCQDWQTAKGIIGGICCPTCNGGW